MNTIYNHPLFKTIYAHTLDILESSDIGTGLKTRTVLIREPITYERLSFQVTFELYEDETLSIEDFKKLDS